MIVPSNQNTVPLTDRLKTLINNVGAPQIVKDSLLKEVDEKGAVPEVMDRIIQSLQTEIDILNLTITTITNHKQELMNGGVTAQPPMPQPVPQNMLPPQIPTPPAPQPPMSNPMTDTNMNNGASSNMMTPPWAQSLSNMPESPIEPEPAPTTTLLINTPTPVPPQAPVNSQPTQPANAASEEQIKKDTEELQKLLDDLKKLQEENKTETK